jgi:hypothetical protein
MGSGMAGNELDAMGWELQGTGRVQTSGSPQEQ